MQQRLHPAPIHVQFLKPFARQRKVSMIDRYGPINPKCPHFLHGGDYNPDQWPQDVWKEDMRLMGLASCNAMSVGIFAWAAMEPAEGRFEFGWLDRVMDSLAGSGAYAVLATPSGSKPAWMSQKYPEVCRVNRDGRREPHGRRHNHCRTSGVYREKAQLINRKLAERYKDHPALLVWHISNEYNGGQCFCELCLAAWRDWLRAKYADLDQLNHAWWTAFWGHTFTDWDQILPVDSSICGMMLDWWRFISDQTIDFYRDEIVPLRELTPNVPITTNFMGINPTLDYWKFAGEVDVVSWDSYPAWHGPGGDAALACGTAFVHDIYRAMKAGKPFMLMESVPSATNWMDVAKLKRPGMHLLSSLQAVAHGSDTVQYFQWRKGRGGSEKFHGAVVDHHGSEDSRVFADVAEVGAALKKLDAVIGTTVRPETAVIYDWHNRWGIDLMAGLGEDLRQYAETCIRHYRPLWSRGVPVDVIEELCDFSRYKLLIAPMLYMLRAGVAERLEKFVAEGGTLVMTYWSGIVDENDLAFENGWPGAGLREVLGIRDEETDATWPHERNSVVMAEGNSLGMTGSYEARDLYALIHAEGAEVLATYGRDFYAGRPALTVKGYGEGKAYYIASRNDESFLHDFYGRLTADLGIGRVLEADLPEGVTAQMRTDGRRRFIFLMNFSDARQMVDLGAQEFTDILAGADTKGQTTLEPYGIKVLERNNL